MAVAAPQPQGEAKPLAQGSDDEQIDKLKVELRRPGPEARQKRESAVAQLIAMRVPKAHNVLQEALSAPGDPDSVGLTILNQLRAKLGNPSDPVLGEEGDDLSRKLRASYLPSVVLLLGRNGVRDERTESARRVLLDFPWDRVSAFRDLLKSSDRKIQLAAARAAGSCRDLGVASVLATYLSSPDDELRELARSSLADLTFQTFEDRAAFEAWHSHLGGKAYVDVAEEAARASSKGRREDREKCNQRAIEYVLELITSYVQRPEINWAAIQRHALAGEPMGVLAPSLAKLRDLLRDAGPLTGSAPDRQAFYAELQTRLDGEPTVAERALMLEVSAYLVAAGENDPRAQTEQRLLAALRPEQPPALRKAALAGLRRFPSDTNRAVVVDAAKRAWQRHELELVQAAMATLHAKSWTAPRADAPGRSDWIGLIERCIADPDLSTPIGREVLAMLKLRDADQERVPEAFELLRRLVLNTARDVGLRHLALLQIGNEVVGDTAGDEYVDLLQSCLADNAREIRERSAQLLPDIPSASPERAKVWRRSLLAAAHGRLLVEPDAAVLAALAESMKRIAEQAGDAQNVLDLLAVATEALANAPAERREPFRRDAIVDALRVLASSPDRAPSLWVRAGEALQKVGDLTSLRQVLERHREALAHPDLDAAVRRRADLLVVAAAERLTAPGCWADPTNRAEADDVLAAVHRLEADKALPSDLAITLLRMDIQGDLGQYDHVVALAATLPRNGDSPLAEEARQRAALRTATALLELQQPVAAWEWLHDLLNHGGSGPAVNQVLDRTARALVDKDEFDQAADAYGELLARTGEKEPSYPDVVLRYTDALHRAKRTEAARRLLDEKATVFARDDLPLALRQRYAELRGLVGNS